MYLAATTLVVGVLAIGAVHRWGAVVTCALAVVAFAPMLRSQRTGHAISPLAIFLGLALALTVLQLVPLPAGLVRLLSPATYDTIAGNAAALGDPAPGWLPITLDRPGTVVETAKLAAYLVFALVCIRLAAQERGRMRLLQVVTGIASALALVGLAHEAVGAEALFGIYAPRDMPAPPYMSPLLNSNHFSAYLAMAAPLALALAIHARGTTRLLWFGSLLLLVAVCLLLKSRGGSLALVLGLTAGTGIWLLGRRARALGHTKRTRSTNVGMAVVVLSTLVLVGALSAGGVVQEFAATRSSEFKDPRSKFAAWTSASYLLRDFRWTGVGRGAFETAFTRHHPASSELTFSRLENEYLQAAVEWGVPAAAALVLALVFACVVASRRWADGPLEAGALGAGAAIAVQNGFDFSLELPSVALAAIAVLATLLYVPLTSPRELQVPAWVRRARYAGCLLAAIAVLLAALPFARSAREDGDRLAALAADGSVGRDRVVAAGRTAMRRHPADYYPAGVVGYALTALGDPEAIRYVNRSLYLHPRHSGVHLIAARALRAFGQRQQSLIEYGLALRYGADIAAVTDEVLTHYPAVEDAAHAVPIEPRIGLKVATHLARTGRLDVALVAGRRLVRYHPTHVPSLLFLANAILQSGGEPGEAIALATRAHQLASSPRSAIVLANALRASGDDERALAILGEGLAAADRTASHQDNVDVLYLLSQIHHGRGELALAREKAQAILGLSGIDNRTRAIAHAHLARIEEAAGNDHQARWEKEQANALNAD